MLARRDQDIDALLGRAVAAQNAAVLASSVCSLQLTTMQSSRGSFCWDTAVHLNHSLAPNNFPEVRSSHRRLLWVLPALASTQQTTDDPGDHVRAWMQVQLHFGLVKSVYATRLRQRAGDMLRRGFEWTLQHGEPRNTWPTRYPLMPPCCESIDNDPTRCADLTWTKCVSLISNKSVIILQPC
jgi:hypothetical protein